MTRHFTEDSFTWGSALRILTLCTFATAHPLYELLGQPIHVPFLITHESTMGDFAGLILLVSFAVPALVAMGLWLGSRVFTQTWPWAHAVVTAVLFAITFHPFTSKVWVGLPMFALVGAAVAALAASFTFHSREGVRQFVSAMSIIVIASPALLLTSDPVRGYFERQHTTQQKAAPEANGKPKPNVVLIVFDQLPITSLLDEAREIDRDLFPNFARLADTSTWHRNASTLYQKTLQAIPSLLTGSRLDSYRERLALEVPDKERERTADLKLYPENLFNFLTESHDVIAIESVTQLAPALDKNKPRISERKIPFSVFLMDSLVLLGHATLPYSGSFLPDVGQQWTNFAGTARGHADEDWPYLGPKPHKVRAFIDLLEPGKAPGFYYLHLVLPHLPFEYSEGGKMDSARYRVPYANVQNRSGLNRWGSETLNTIAQQSHLIQLAFVDMMFGKIMDKLEAENLFDDSLLIVTADHGVSFFWDDEKLPLADAKAIWNFELDQIPLLIKKPNQVDSIVSDTPVESIDIAPTIAEAVGRNLPWEADGKSILHAAAPSEHESRAHDDLAFAPDRFILSQKSKTFGSHSLESVYNIGPHKEIVGRSIAEFEHGVSELAGVLRRRQEEVELESPLLPTYVVGSARSVARKKRAIAIVINEKIRGTVEVLFDEEEEDFLVRIPPQSWRPGRNDISLYEIARGENGDAISLSKVGP